MGRSRSCSSSPPTWRCCKAGWPICRPVSAAKLEPVLDRLSNLVESALQEIRATLSTFRPAEFQRRSIESVLQGLTFQHEVLTGNQVDLYIAGPIPPVALPVKIALYRVLQEALANSYRHSGVDTQEVYLTEEDGWIILEIIDDGIGFTPPPLDGPGATEREEHIGLRGMRDRIAPGGRAAEACQPARPRHARDRAGAERCVMLRTETEDCRPLSYE